MVAYFYNLNSQQSVKEGVYMEEILKSEATCSGGCMSDYEKYQALLTILATGENPRLFEFDPLDFVEELYMAYVSTKQVLESE